MEGEKIIGYYDYYYDKYEYTRKGNGNGKVKTHVDKPANDVNKFFYNDSICPFCSTQLEKVFLGMQSFPREKDYFHEGYVLKCPKCNWWTYKTHFSESFDDYSQVYDICTDERYYAIMKSYDISDKKVPIEVLSTELKKKTELLYHIDPDRLEKLTQSILSDVFDCEVQHVGRSGDGGKDLIVLESDAPILVQVKRRQNPNHVELIQGVRELVGTLYIENERKGLYVTTAKQFSRGSQKLRKQILDNRQLDYFEYINYDKLCYWLKEKNEENPWEKLISQFYENQYALVYEGKEKVEKFEKDSKRELHDLLSGSTN